MVKEDFSALYINNVNKDGRPKAYTEYQLKNAMDLLANGNSYTDVVAKTGISKSTLIREKRKSSS